MFRTFILGMTLAATFAAPALAEEGIVGTWKRPNGTIISYASCGANKFCGTVQTGEYKGKSIGTMSGTGGSSAQTMGLRLEDVGRPRTAEAMAGGIRRLTRREAIRFESGSEGRVAWLKAPSAVPIYVAGSGPRMLAAAGRAGDGAIVYASTFSSRYIVSVISPLVV